MTLTIIANRRFARAATWNLENLDAVFRALPMSDSDNPNRAAIMYRLTVQWYEAFALSTFGGVSSAFGIITQAQGWSQAQILTWVGLVSTVAGLISSGLLIFARRASGVALEETKKWDAYYATTWKSKAEAWEKTAVREAAEHEETRAELKSLKTEVAELRSMLGDAYDRIERLTSGRSNTPRPVDRPNPKTKPTDK